MNTKYWNHFQKLLVSEHMSLSATSVVRGTPTFMHAGMWLQAPPPTALPPTELFR